MLIELRLVVNFTWAVFNVPNEPVRIWSSVLKSHLPPSDYEYPEAALEKEIQCRFGFETFQGKNWEKNFLIKQIHKQRVTSTC